MQQSRDIEEEKSREKKVCKYLPGGTVRPTQAHILLQRGLERPRPTLLPMEPPLLRHDARWGLTFLREWDSWSAQQGMAQTWSEKLAKTTLPDLWRRTSLAFEGNPVVAQPTSPPSPGGTFVSSFMLTFAPLPAAGTSSCGC